MDFDRGTTTKIIKRYVSTCQGGVSVTDLHADYISAYANDIPFGDWGYTSLVDYLCSVPGLTVRNVDGEFRVQARVSRNASETKSTFPLAAEVSRLSVELKNNLVVRKDDAKRKVIVSNNSAVTYRPRNAVPRPSRIMYKPCEQSAADTRPVAKRTPLGDDQSAAPVDYPSSMPATEYVDYFAAAAAVPNGGDYEYGAGYEQSFAPSTPYDASTKHQSRPSSSSSLFDDYRHSSSSGDDFRASPYPLAALSDCGSPYVRVKHPLPPPPAKIPDEQVVKRVCAVVNAYSERSSSTVVERRYRDTYPEPPLPDNWLSLLQHSNLLYVENTLDAVYVYPNRKFSSAPTIDALPKLEYPAGGRWSVRIVAVAATNAVWLRLRENHLTLRYQILCHALRTHYERAPSDGVPEARAEQLYAAKRPDGQPVRVWVRSRHGDAVECVCVDEGDECVLPVARLMRLHEKFTNTPPLAVCAALSEVRELKCAYLAQKLQRMLLGVDAVAFVDDVEALRRDERPAVNLFVVRCGRTANVNRNVANVIETDFALPKWRAGDVHDVRVLAIDESAALVHVVSPCYDLLQDTLRQATEVVERALSHAGGDRVFADTILQINVDSMYLARFGDGSWQRVSVDKFLGSTRVAVTFVDYGVERVLHASSIVCLAELPDTLWAIPPQLVSVKLVSTECTVLEHLHRACKTNTFSMMVVDTNPKLFVRIYSKRMDALHSLRSGQIPHRSDGCY